MHRHECLENLRQAGRLVLPSLLLCDFGHLADEISRVEQAGVEALHLDVMDGHFVPNLSYGLTLVEAIRKMTKLPLDVHLMITNPASYLDRYYEAGADMITFHVEATDQPRDLLSRIRELGAGAGLALNPDTPLKTIDPCLELCDLVLVMSVMPGFGGQRFETVALEKLTNLRQRLGPATILSVDGGVNEHNIKQCAAAGADWFVAGSAIFKHQDYAQRVSMLKEMVG
ncbi:MAG: ribulose-phosphate 3-epimerase [Planctomycetales bacterium]|nr:ribulose-phosphate 3-epimerase [Planctomycetales bacterium]NIM10049.1 ribulose-phosphate 3-epimerase [Planctomycetales bacterium]NIN09490.1 ribulose-phosphate 3-epimerase [Planctomycetales bacterium]NIN77153.1 ribulose-phosphate 3-epimerase [Planctomycetales bacterium]NIO34337.1 ribulose-phosphate 3-epimerase [Planctomycetales bacterium]